MVRNLLLAAALSVAIIPTAHAEWPPSWESYDAARKQCDHLGKTIRIVRPLRTKHGMTRNELQSEVQKLPVPGMSDQDKVRCQKSSHTQFLTISLRTIAPFKQRLTPWFLSASSSQPRNQSGYPAGDNL